MTTIEIAEKPIYAIGDLHGRFELLVIELKANYTLRGSNLIVCGDIGMGFSKKEYYERTLKSLNKTMESYDVNLYLFRGNHDDPSYFDGNTKTYSNIVLLKDYTILKNSARTILCVGGGLSVDRYNRIKDYERRKDIFSSVIPMCKKEELKQLVLPSYWEDELPTFTEENKKELSESNELIRIDTVCTHTSPSFCFKRDKKGLEYWFGLDDDLEKDLDKEREVLTLLYNCLRENQYPIKDWVYGHFHAHNVEDINGIIFTALLHCDKAFDIKELK
jgi:predicted phosphodiesterase